MGRMGRMGRMAKMAYAAAAALAPAAGNESWTALGDGGVPGGSSPFRQAACEWPCRRPSHLRHPVNPVHPVSCRSV